MPLTLIQKIHRDALCLFVLLIFIHENIVRHYSGKQTVPLSTENNKLKNISVPSNYSAGERPPAYSLNNNSRLLLTATYRNQNKPSHSFLTELSIPLPSLHPFFSFIPLDLLILHKQSVECS